MALLDGAGPCIPVAPRSEGPNCCPPPRLRSWGRQRWPYHGSVAFRRGDTGTISVGLLFALVTPPFWPLPYVFWTKLISYCSSPHKWNCSPCGPLPLFMLAETRGYWQANLDGIPTVRGQGGKKGHTVALSAFACLAEWMPTDREKGGHRWGESSPRWSGAWAEAGFEMLRSERYFRSC